MSKKATPEDNIRFLAYLTEQEGFSYTAKQIVEALEQKKYNNILILAEELETVGFANVPADLTKAATALITQFVEDNTK